MGRNKSSERKTSNRLHVAEARKTELEAQILENKLRAPWYRNSEFVKWVVGGVVCAGLLAIWAVRYLEPILSVKQELAALEIEKRELKTEIEAVKNERIRILLLYQFESWQAELAEMSADQRDVGNRVARAEQFITLASFVLANYTEGSASVSDALAAMEEMRPARTRRFASSPQAEFVGLSDQDDTFLLHVVCKAPEVIVTPRPHDSSEQSQHNHDSNFLLIPEAWRNIRLTETVERPSQFKVRKPSI